MAERKERVVLVGFMGAGKSSVGRSLAGRLGWRFVDLDRSIEERTGATIAALFRERGEAAFRALEEDAARSVASLSDTVVAAGGGAFAAPATRALLRQGALTRVAAVQPRGRAAPGPDRRQPSACREP